MEKTIDFIDEKYPSLRKTRREMYENRQGKINYSEHFWGYHDDNGKWIEYDWRDRNDITLEYGHLFWNIVLDYPELKDFRADLNFQMSCPDQIEKTFLMIKHYFPNHNSILDFGCGPGEVMAYLCEFGFNPVGIDNYDEMIQISKSLLDKLDFNPNKIVKVDFTDENFSKKDLFGKKPGEFDIIYCFQPKEMYSSMFSSINKFLKKDGRIFIPGWDFVHDDNKDIEKFVNKFGFTREKFDEYLAYCFKRI